MGPTKTMVGAQERNGCSSGNQWWGSRETIVVPGTNSLRSRNQWLVLRKPMAEVQEINGWGPGNQCLGAQVTNCWDPGNQWLGPRKPMVGARETNGWSRGNQGHPLRNTAAEATGSERNLASGVKRVGLDPGSVSFAGGRHHGANQFATVARRGP